MSDKDSLFDSDEEDERVKRKLPEEPVNEEESKKKRPRNMMIEDEAERGSDDADSDEDSDEEDRNEYVEDGFVVRDEAPDSDDEGVEKDVAQKKSYDRLKRGTMQMLDQEDLELIAENAGAREPRVVDEIVPERVKAPRKISFREEDGEVAVEGDEEDEDDEDDFLADDGEDDEPAMGGAQRGEAGGDAMRVRPPRREMRIERGAAAYGPSRDQIEEARDIFGDDYEDYEEEDLYDEDDELDPARQDDPTRDMATLRSTYEHTELLESFCTDLDEAIRKLDYPERLIDVSKGKASVRRSPSKADERDQEVCWITNRLLADTSLGLSTAVEKDLSRSIKYILGFLQDDSMDVPFIWAYRRDYLSPCVSRAVLWRAGMLDEEWAVFHAKKTALLAELQALEDAAESNELAGEREETRESLELEDLTNTRSLLLLQVEDAAIEYNRLRNLSALSDATVVDKSQEESALKECESLTAALRATEARLAARHDEARGRARRRALSAKYSPSLAARVLHLFPPMRYQPLIAAADDETELKDVSKYFSLVLKGCRSADDATLTGAASEGPKSAKQVQKRLRAISEVDEYCRYAHMDTVRGFVESFAVSAADLGDGMRHGLAMKVEPLAPEIEATAAAAALVDPLALFSVEAVLRAAQIVCTTELANEPSVRRGARDIYRRMGTVSTCPTPKGLLEINPFHPLFGLHRLVHKPINDFFSSASSAFAQLLRAESEGLITLSIDPPRGPDGTPSSNAFLHHFPIFQLFMPTLDPSTEPNYEVRKTWDEQRLIILVACIEKHLIPSLKAEIRRELVRISRDAILAEAVESFRRLVSIGPFRGPEGSTRDLLLRCPNRPTKYSVACLWVAPDHKGPLCMAFVDALGVVKAHSVLPERASTQKRDRVASFIKDNKPDVIVLNASGGEAARSLASMLERYVVNEVAASLEREAQELRDERLARNDYYDDELDDEEVRYAARVVIAKDEVAQIFAVSRRAKLRFPDFEPGVCGAVSLARYIQEPLTELCALWTTADSTGVFGSEAFFLDIHPQKDLLRGSRSVLLASLQRVLCDAVCDVGVDVNLAAAHDHWAPLLAFVGGLGLRKADALRQDIRRKLGSSVRSRKELLERKILPRVVYSNCIGFLRVRDQDDTGETLCDPLDDTRIHPECYISHNFAPKICSDALEVPLALEYAQVILSIMQNSKQILERKLDTESASAWLAEWEALIASSGNGGERRMEELQDLLSELELSEYVMDLENKGLGKRARQCEQIKEELRYPWLDLRRPLLQPSPYEAFRLVTKANDYVLYVGLQVSCRVEEIKDKSAALNVEGTYRGFVSVRNLSSERHVESPYEVLKVGMNRAGVVIGIDKERQVLDVSFREEHLALDESAWMARRGSDEHMVKWWSESERANTAFDEYFDEATALREYSDAMAQSKEPVATAAVKTGPANTNRLVYHPLFENCTFQQAEATLQGRAVGQVIFRPSSKGPQHISITWHFRPGMFKHIDVVEKNKRQGDLGLAEQLEIVIARTQKEVFSDLDDIFAGYIQPMNTHVSALAAHPAFFPGAHETVAACLQQRYSENPSRVHYLVSVNPTSSSHFLISWLSVKGPKSMEIIVTPAGYMMGGKTHAKPSELINYFKEQVTSNASA